MALALLAASIVFRASVVAGGEPGTTTLAQAQVPSTRSPTMKVPPAPSSPANSGGAGWAVTCSDRVGGRFVCQMTQVIVDGSTRAVLLSMSITTPNPNSALAILFRAMHGVYLPAGITLAIDGRKPNSIAFQKSDRAGVYAALPLAPALIGELSKGREMSIAMELDKGRKLEVKVPLEGFAKAFGRVTAGN
jgi:invasion protein IalB